MYILDGAMGTMLIKRGLLPGTPPDSWCLSHPEEVKDVHSAYASAGADIITTNTFGANSFRLGAADFSIAEISNIIHMAVELAASASQGKLVAGDIGPTGLLLQPIGDLTAESAYNSFRRQAGCLVETGIDLFLIETFFSLDEALLALRAAQDSSDLPCWVSLTFRATRRGYFTIHGERPKYSMEKLLGAGADMVGANCTLGSDEMRYLAEELVPDFGDRLFFQPNAGQPIPTESGVLYPETPDQFASSMKIISDLGVGALGGCCGTTPAHIRELHLRCRGNHT